MPRTVAPALGTYSMRQFGGVTGGLRSYRFLHDNCGAALDKIGYHHKHNVLRIFPARNPEDPNQWLPCRLSSDPGDFSDWIRRYPAVVGFGSPSQAWIIGDPRDPDYDPATTPVNLLHRAIKSAVQTAQFSNPRWAQIITDQRGQNGILHPATDVFLVQGMSLMLGGRVFREPKGASASDQLQVFYLSKSAGQALLTRLNEVDANQQPVIPDIVEWSGGSFVDFFQAGTPPLTAAPMQQQAQVGTLGAVRGVAQSGGGNVSDDKSYDVDFLDQFTTPAYGVIGPQIVHEQLLRTVQSKIRVWDEIVRVPELGEQINWICRAGIPPDAIVHGLAELYRDHIPADVMDAYIRPPSTPGAVFQQPGQTPAGGFGAPAGQGGFAPVGTPAAGQAGFSTPLSGLAGQSGFGTPVASQPVAQQPVQQPVGYGPPAPGFPQATFPPVGQPTPGQPILPPVAAVPAQPAQLQPPVSAQPTPAASATTPPNGQGYDPAPPGADARRANAMNALQLARAKARQPAAN
jgi:hypothetical protein